MILYHGTNINFSTIDLSASHKGKDFGKGFYLSDNESQAYDFAVFKSIQLGGTPIVHSFKFDESMLSSGTLNYLCFQKYSREWANFVLANRRNTQKENIHAHDIVYGPIANDKVGVQIRNFMEGNIDFDTFLKKLAFMKGITFQYFFGHATCHRPFRKNMSEIEYMKECMARDLVVMLVDEQKMSLHGALDALYQSETYAKLKDTRSGLYFQSPVYVYGFLRKEILTGKM